jgi:hypothetical protein
MGGSSSNPDHRGERLTERKTAAAFNNQLTGGEGQSCCLHERVEPIAVACSPPWTIPHFRRVGDRKKQLPS